MTIRTFIERPILAGVISVVILIVGLIGLSQLPIEQFPEIAPPTVSVSATYTGANAETVQKSVVVPLEEALNGVENMMYMTSTASNNGSAKISVFFRQGTDPDMATVNVQNRIATAQGLLPAEVTKSGITVRKRQTSNIKQLAVYSPDDSFDEAFLTNYMKINIEPRLSRIAGVGEVNVFGYEYSMRIWLDPAKMQKYGLVPSDITTVLDEQNVEAPTGTLGAESENTFQYVLKYRGRYEHEADYENMVIKSLPDGEVLRLKDVATVELGTRAYDYINEVNGHPGCNIMIAQTSGSNANEIIEEIDRTVAEISKTLPEGIKIVDLMSTKDFLDASIRSVIKTLIEAIILVVLVVYVFLQSLRSTFIPALSIIVSLVGTFAFLYAAGFSLNMLTLFALVLVIGTVVDDAIVVVEAVQAKFDEGYRSAYRATIDAMDGITSALVTTTFVFMAVFIPVSFIGGYVLHPVRSDNGRRRGHFAHQRPHAQPGPLRTHHDPASERRRGPEAELFVAFPHCVRCGVPPAGVAIQVRRAVHAAPQVAGRSAACCGVRGLRASHVYDQDRSSAQRGYGNRLHRRAHLAR